jgi:hypothetical protein
MRPGTAALPATLPALPAGRAGTRRTEPWNHPGRGPPVERGMESRLQAAWRSQAPIAWELHARSTRRRLPRLKPGLHAGAEEHATEQPGGLQEWCRWLSEATPPDTVPTPHNPAPRRGARTHATTPSCTPERDPRPTRPTRCRERLGGKRPGTAALSATPRAGTRRTEPWNHPGRGPPVERGMESRLQAAWRSQAPIAWELHARSTRRRLPRHEAGTPCGGRGRLHDLRPSLGRPKRVRRDQPKAQRTAKQATAHLLAA